MKKISSITGKHSIIRNLLLCCNNHGFVIAMFIVAISATLVFYYYNNRNSLDLYLNIYLESVITVKKRKKPKTINIMKKEEKTKNNRGKSAESIKWITFGIASVIYKVYPINDKSMTVYAVYMFILMILLNTSLYKHRNENLGVKYNFAFAITLNLLVIYVLISMALNKYSPIVFEKYNTLLGVFALVLFFIFVGVVIYGSEKSNRDDED